MWEFECDVKQVVNLMGSLSAVVRESILVVKPNGLSAIALNMSNTVFVDAFVGIDITGEFKDIGIDNNKISMILPSTGDIMVKYNGYYLNTIIGKSKYKFECIDPINIRTPKKPNIPTLPTTISDISPKDLFDATSKIGLYNSDKATALYKARVVVENGELFIRDKDEMVSTQIDGSVSGEDSLVIVSSEFLYDIVSFYKKHINGGVTIEFKDDNSPLRIQYNDGVNYFNYLIAPMVAID